MRKILILLILYAAAYGGFRQTHIEVWEKDNQAYVIFPTGSLGKAMYYAWRPLTYADAALTGMRFHIGAHQ
ncbi:MAG: hypothetical protein MPJ78_14835 [Hyphomicrobiaceae bacterium]|nr:hypothetical protein [Hyphomicrobiaceae bacterium]